VNDRLDVALAAGAEGVHLGERSLPVPEVHRFLQKHMKGEQFLVGVSVHALMSVQEAAANGADYVIFGPVFPTPSKLQFGPPRGLQELAEACKAVAIPVLAIGGITVENAPGCVMAGAAGVAAIRLFQDANSVKDVVKALCPAK